MSRWLQNVGSFLEKLDDRAERVVEDHIVGNSEDDDHLDSNVLEDMQLKSILTARGLSDVSHAPEAEEDDDYGGEEVNDEVDTVDNNEMGSADRPLSSTGENGTPSTIMDDPGAESASYNSFAKREEMGAEKGSTTTNFTLQPGEAAQTAETQISSNDGPTVSHVHAATAELDSSSPSKPQLAGESTGTNAKQAVPRLSLQQVATISASDSAPHVVSPTTHAALREAQKEARNLRRHVVALNKQLEHAETEVKAQRDELERAAERLEKDRIRQKEDREKEKTRHAEEVKSLKAQNEKAMKELKLRLEKQVEEVRKQLRDVEERRMQEGGDWNKELLDAIQREQEMAQNYAILEDEKATLLSQISILQDQQEALGSRLESLSQTAENAMEREREAENRLDEALNVHARQIAQRQARESELERTVGELGAALVAARSRNSSNSNTNGGSSKLSDQESFASSTPEAQLQSLQHELESLVTQLNYERQRSETLQNELRDISKERTDEATAYHARQVKDDRKIAELSHKIARLESEHRSSNWRHGSGSGSMESHDAEQMRELSEEVMRQRDKIANCHSEISALKSRLKVANERVQRAESALESRKSDDWHDVEQAPVSGNDGMRRRNGGSSRHSSLNSKAESIRAALHLDDMRGKSSEQIGKALDGVDAFLATSGRFLRHNALARLIFIAYLLLLHIWTFVLIILHAHGFERVHGDFGAGEGLSHGPHALMQEHLIPGVVAPNVSNSTPPVVAAVHA